MPETDAASLPADAGLPPPRPRDWLVLALLVLAANSVGWIGALFTDTGPGSWYADLVKPAWTPPGAVFPLVWTVLYVLMALSAWRVWRRGQPFDSPPLLAWWTQLALNAAWTPIFFALHRIELAFVVISMLVVAIAVTIRRFQPVDPVAAWMLLPYLVWCGFGALLNATISALNG